jgi:hypothetical protein
MDLLPLLQEGARLIIHPPSGRPRCLSSAINRSVAVSALAIRAILPSLPIYSYTRVFLATAGSLAIITLLKFSLELLGGCTQQTGLGSYTALKSALVLGLGGFGLLLIGQQRSIRLG